MTDELLVEDKHVFTTKDGTEYEFDTEEAMEKFAYQHTVGTLVAQGYGSMVLIDGEEAFQINDIGRAALSAAKSTNSADLLAAPESSKGIH